MFGGPASNGIRFRETLLFHDGRALPNAAVLTIIRPPCAVRVFSLDHLMPTEQRMAVTLADPARHVLRPITAEPAARKYARILKLDPDQLTASSFAAHPVVLRIGGRHHVRAIQRTAPNGNLIFFSAIDARLVLTLAELRDLVSPLDHEVTRLAADHVHDTTHACNCILRRIEAQQERSCGQISDLLRRHNLIGFSTYGEQICAMHANQTITGVAI